MKPTVIISWVLIVVIAVAIPLLNHFGQRGEKSLERATENGPDWLFESQAKYIFGSAKAFNDKSVEFSHQLNSLAGSEQQRIAAAIVAGELEGKDQALVALGKISDPEADDIAGIYRGDEKLRTPEWFYRHYPWHYRLSQSFAKPDTDPIRAGVLSEASRYFRGGFVLIILLLFVGSVSIVLLLMAIILLATGWLKFRTQRAETNGQYYIESFAIYLSTFFGMGLVVLYFQWNVPIQMLMIVQGLFTLFAASWPMMRGVSFSDYRNTVGMHMGRGIFTEIGTGILGYLAGLPLVIAGMLLSYLLVMLTREVSTHPITYQINELNPWVLIAMASVFAPLTEELMFRGIFVSHLRGWCGVLLSAVISGLIFAAVHPQGWVAIPVLGIIGANFALIRQWRASLIPSIAAHALHNGMLVGFLLLVSR